MPSDFAIVTPLSPDLPRISPRPFFSLLQRAMATPRWLLRNGCRRVSAANVVPVMCTRMRIILFSPFFSLFLLRHFRRLLRDALFIIYC